MKCGVKSKGRSKEEEGKIDSQIIYLHSFNSRSYIISKKK
jgi:hypothetical protein